MKAKLLVDGKEIEMELTCEQETQVQELCKDEFDIEYNKDTAKSIHGDGCIWYNNLNPNYINQGAIRQTKELAERASKNMRERNRLEELVHWLEPDWVPDWDNNKQVKYHVYYSCNNLTFSKDMKWKSKIIGAVFMSEKTCNIILDGLNKGELPELAEILKGKTCGMKN